MSDDAVTKRDIHREVDRLHADLGRALTRINELEEQMIVFKGGFSLISAMLNTMGTTGQLMADNADCEYTSPFRGG